MNPCMNRCMNRRLSSRRWRWRPVSLWALAALLLAACGWSWWPDSQAVETGRVSDGEASAVVAPHPRLLFGVADVDALRARAESSHREIWSPIHEFTTQQAGSTPPAAAPADGDLDAYRNFGNELIPYAFACLITEEADDCELAETYLLTYAGWTQWGEHNYRDLGLAHMLLANALAYDWLASRLTAAERQTVRESLGLWAQRLYEASSGPREEGWENWWRKSYIQNHYWTANSALGVAGLALLGEDERAALWVDHAAERMMRVQALLNGIEDGSWHEGISYQNYGLTLSLPFWVNLREVQGRDIVPYSYLQNYAYWRLYNYLPGSDDFILSYGDFDPSWGNSYSAQNVLRFVAAEFENGHAEWVARRLVEADGRAASIWRTPWYVFEFFYYDAEVVPQAPTDLPTTRTFPDLEGVIWRSGWRADDLVFALKTGAYGGRFAFDTFTEVAYPWEAPCAETGCQFNAGHDHEDTNAFYLYRNGQWLAPETAGVNDHETEFHNVLLIDGQEQFRPENDERQEPDAFRGSDGVLIATTGTPHFALVRADATRRYRSQIEDLQTVTRTVLFVRPDYFLVLDRVIGTRPHSATWISHFGADVALEGDWVRGASEGEPLLGVQTVAPSNVAATTGNDGRPFVHIQPAEPTDDLRLIHLLWPGDTTAWAKRPSASVVAETDAAVLLRVQWNDGSGRTDELVLNEGELGTVRDVGPYSLDGRAAVVSRGRDGSLDRLFLYQGSHLRDRDQGRELMRIEVNAETPAQGEAASAGYAVEAVYTQERVAIHRTADTLITVNAPGATALTLNGEPWPFTRDGDQITISPSDSITQSEPITQSNPITQSDMYLPLIGNDD